MEKQIIGPGIVVYKNIIKKEWDLINRYESILNSGKVYSWKKARVGYFETDNSHRNCYDFQYTEDSLGPVTEYNRELYEMHSNITNGLKQCLIDYGHMFAVNIQWIGAINVVKYGENEFFNVHSDDGDPFRCTVSSVAYINDNYEGGELYFKYLDLTHKFDAGDLALFPSSYIYAHASLPVKSGVKYSLVTMTDRNEFAHRKDSPIYTTVDNG